MQEPQTQKIIRIFFIIFGFLSSCTTIGFHQKEKRDQINFGPERTIQVCTIHEPGIEEAEISDLFSAWNEELQLYQLKVQSVPLGEMKRPGFYGGDILDHLYSISLDSPCDRILYLKGRNWKDIVFEFFTLGIFAGVGLKLEVQGAVETNTHSRGYVKAKYISTLQLLFTSPKSTLVHEGYHLLGCGHQFLMEDCYKKIHALKEFSKDPRVEPNYFPSITTKGKKYFDRKEVNRSFTTNPATK